MQRFQEAKNRKTKYFMEQSMERKAWPAERKQAESRRAGLSASACTADARNMAVRHPWTPRSVATCRCFTPRCAGDSQNSCSQALADDEGGEVVGADDGAHARGARVQGLHLGAQHPHNGAPARGGARGARKDILLSSKTS